MTEEKTKPDYRAKRESKFKKMLTLAWRSKEKEKGDAAVKKAKRRYHAKVDVYKKNKRKLKARKRKKRKIARESKRRNR